MMLGPCFDLGPIVLQSSRVFPRWDAGSNASPPPFDFVSRVRWLTFCLYPVPRPSYVNGRPNPVARGKPMRASRATGRSCLLPLPRARRPELRRPLRRLVSLKVGLSLSTGLFKIRMASDASRCGVGLSRREPLIGWLVAWSFGCLNRIG